MAQQFANNARALLTASITNTATSIVIESAKADLFPVANVGTGSLPSANSWFKATLQDSTGAVEIVAVRTRAAGSGVLSNVIRGYEGTTALAFVAGTVFGIRITAGDVQAGLDLPNQNSVFTGDNSFTGDNAFSGSNAFTGSVTAPTKISGDSSTSLATTAFVQAALQAMYPVGCIYTSTASQNPSNSNVLGFGTWVAFGAGRVIVGQGSGYVAGTTGGSANAVIVSHTHTAGVNDPGHRHNTALDGNAATNSTFQPQAGLTTYSTADGGYEGYYSRGVADSTQANASTSSTSTTGIVVTNVTTGVSGTNANLQPYIVAYMWTRTA